MKKVKFLLILIFVIFAIVLIYFYSRPKYSFDDIVQMLDKTDEISDNMSIKIETLYVDGRMYTNEIYAKYNIIYNHQEVIENDEITYASDEIWNYLDKSIITILHNNKLIYNEKIKGNGKSNPLTNEAMGFSRDLKSTRKRFYKYYGVTEIEEQEFLKFSTESEDGTAKEYYYICLENENLLKMETYWNDEHRSTTTVTYSYDTVTDDDILKFDSNNYPDYQYTNDEYHL